MLHEASLISLKDRMTLPEEFCFEILPNMSVLKYFQILYEFPHSESFFGPDYLTEANGTTFNKSCFPVHKTCSPSKNKRGYACSHQTQQNTSIGWILCRVWVQHFHMHNVVCAISTNTSHHCSPQHHVSYS